MADIRIDAGKAERMIAQILRDERKLLPADANANRLRMKGVSVAADAPQEVVDMFDAADRHLVAGGAAQSGTEAACVQRLAAQACLGPA